MVVTCQTWYNASTWSWVAKFVFEGHPPPDQPNHPQHPLPPISPTHHAHKLPEGQVPHRISMSLRADNTGPPVHIPEAHAAIFPARHQVPTTDTERRSVHGTLMATQGEVPGNIIWCQRRRGGGSVSGGRPIRGCQRSDVNGRIVKATGDVVCGESRTVHAGRGDKKEAYT